jgi:hypothetical protein
MADVGWSEVFGDCLGNNSLALLSEAQVLQPELDRREASCPVARNDLKVLIVGIETVVEHALVEIIPGEFVCVRSIRCRKKVTQRGGGCWGAGPQKKNRHRK